jgi:putative redox protein
MNSKEVSFEGFDGSLLSARLDLPDGKPRAYALFAHCFTCSKDIPAARRLSSSLASEQIAVMSFDFTGLGHSEGEFANTNFHSNVQDLEKAAEFLSENYEAPQILIGHSLGGAAALLAGSRIDSLRAVVTIAAPSEPSHVSNLLSGSIEELNEKGFADVEIAGRTFSIKSQFLEDINKANLTEATGNLKAALLVLHSPIDNIVSVDNAAEIFMRAKHPKSFVSLDDADHLLRNPKHSEYAATVITGWLQKYLDPIDKKISSKAPDGAVTVSEVSADGFKQDVLIGSHHLIADEPEDIGGTDSGPTPYQYVAAGLGACTSMTIRLYARRKEIPLVNVSVEVLHEKRHAEQDP